MQITLERTEKETAKVRLQINVNESKETHIAMNETQCIHSETIERVTQFAYLGSIIDNTGRTKVDNTARI